MGTSCAATAALLFLFVWLSIWLSACKPAEDSHMKAIVGAVLIDGLGGPQLSDSVVVTATGRIREAGARSTVLVPAEADRIDGAGRFLVPTPDDPSEHACLDGIPVLLARVESGISAGPFPATPWALSWKT